MASPVRVLHIRATAFVGGPEKQILHHIPHLEPLGFRVLIGSFLQGTEGTALLAYAAELGVDAIGFACRGPLDISPVRPLAGEIRRRQIALVCAHDAKSLLIGYGAARLAKVPIVAWSRGWTGETLRMRLYERVHKALLRRADLVVAVSQAQGKRCEQIGVQRASLRVVANAVDVEGVAGAQSADIRRELHLPAWSRLVFSVGRLSPEKGHRFLLATAPAVLARHSDAYFLVLGDGQERNRLVRQAQLLGVSARVIFCGFRQDAAALMRQGDLLVLPSLTEGLPNVVLEAFAAGLPVVATDVGGVGELVRPGTGWLVPGPDGPGGSDHGSPRFGEGRQTASGGGAPPGNRGVFIRAAGQTARGALSGGARRARSWQVGAALLRSPKVAMRSARLTSQRDPRSDSRPILHVIQSAGRGGSELVFLTLTRALHAAGRPVVFAVGEDGWLVEELRKLGVPVHVLPGLGLKKRSGIWSVRALHRLVRTNGIGLVHAMMFPVQLYACAAARLAHCPCIINVRNSHYDLTGPRRRFVWRHLISRAAPTVVTVTESLAEEARRLTGSERVLCIHNGVDTDRFRPNRAASGVRAELGLPDDGLVIGTLGNIRPVKGYHDFVRAAALIARDIPSARFLVVGAEHEPTTGELRQFCRARRLSDRVVFAGHRQDVPDVLNAMDIFCLPSLSEGMSNSLLQAMAVGLPVVATAVGGNLEVIVDGATGHRSPASAAGRARPRPLGAVEAAGAEATDGGNRPRSGAPRVWVAGNVGSLSAPLR